MPEVKAPVVRDQKDLFQHDVRRAIKELSKAGAIDEAALQETEDMAQVPSDFVATATGAVNTALSVTLPAPGSGLYHYITKIELVKLYAVVGVANGAGNIITSSNLPGSPSWTVEQTADPAGTAKVVINWEMGGSPIRSAAVNAATVLTAPQQLQTIWRWNVAYYTGE